MDYKPKFDGMMIIYTVSGLTAIVGGIVEAVFLSESIYTKLIENLFGKLTIVTVVICALAMCAGFGLHYSINSPKAYQFYTFLGFNIFFLLAMTGLTLGVGISARHNFEEVYNEYVDLSTNPEYQEIYNDFYNKYCDGDSSSDKCLHEGLYFAWKHTGEAGLGILGSFFIFLFTQTGLISQSCKIRKALKEETPISKKELKKTSSENDSLNEYTSNNSDSTVDNGSSIL